MKVNKGKMSAKINVVPIEEDTYGSVLEFLREYFYPNEPCAKALDLCPHGYRLDWKRKTKI